jgi:hypothetical protein
MEAFKILGTEAARMVTVRLESGYDAPIKDLVDKYSRVALRNVICGSAWEAKKPCSGDLWVDLLLEAEKQGGQRNWAAIHREIEGLYGLGYRAMMTHVQTMKALEFGGL